MLAWATDRCPRLAFDGTAVHLFRGVGCTVGLYSVATIAQAVHRPMQQVNVARELVVRFAQVSAPPERRYSCQSQASHMAHWSQYTLTAYGDSRTPRCTGRGCAQVAIIAIEFFADDVVAVPRTACRCNAPPLHGGRAAVGAVAMSAAFVVAVVRALIAVIHATGIKGSLGSRR